MKITPEQELSLIIDILTHLDVPSEEASIIAEVTLDADLKGFTSHGIGRFPQYIKGLEVGTIKPQTEVTVEKESAATARVNGNHGFGHVVTYRSMEMAIQKAKETGIGMVGIHNSNHFGVAGYYSDMAIMEDLIGIVIANTEPAVAPIGGKEPILGTNPLAIGIPSDSHYVSVDMATSASARGKLLESKRKGESIPPNVALDADGNPTTDPVEALKGSILPFGAHKGYALSFMIEIMAGPLVNASYGKAVTGTANPEVTCTKGDLITAIDPSKFVEMDDFKRDVDEFIAEIKATPNVMIPGDFEVRNVKTHQEEGIPLDDTLVEQLREIATKTNVDMDDILG
ncbi:L-sulfolactate dehydrogenase [Methanobacterium formicicum]|uniref:Malate dehydrogenase n=1 Tax=Methanobacterium formicicum (strain DSM 3637 / PP1) TaxID=1204725 RepID=K2QYG2_METFP|nr:L-sulfolactate dehydrogenase [Methanobacterium formicicum]EKF85313.1 malate dehydrogenase [Methanobacterium formicicum DSM 3637]